MGFYKRVLLTKCSSHLGCEDGVEQKSVWGVGSNRLGFKFPL